METGHNEQDLITNSFGNMTSTGKFVNYVGDIEFTCPVGYLQVIPDSQYFTELEQIFFK